VIPLFFFTFRVDPDNRQQIWQIIEGIKNDQTLLVLTTHAMEEADQLCERIGIMSKGEMQAIGESSHLKRKFGRGYSMIVNLIEPGFGEVLDAFVIQELCGGDSRVVIESAMEKKRKYIIPRDSCSLPVVFTEMEDKKDRFSIRDWVRDSFHLF